MCPNYQLCIVRNTPELHRKVIDPSGAFAKPLCHFTSQLSKMTFWLSNTPYVIHCKSLPGLLLLIYSPIVRLNSMVRSTLLDIPVLRPGDLGGPTSLCTFFYENREHLKLLLATCPNYQLGIVRNIPELHRKVIDSSGAFASKSFKFLDFHGKTYTDSLDPRDSRRAAIRQYQGECFAPLSSNEQSVNKLTIRGLASSYSGSHVVCWITKMSSETIE